MRKSLELNRALIPAATWKTVMLIGVVQNSDTQLPANTAKAVVRWVYSCARHGNNVDPR